MISVTHFASPGAFGRPWLECRRSCERNSSSAAATTSFMRRRAADWSVRYTVDRSLGRRPSQRRQTQVSTQQHTTCQRAEHNGTDIWQVYTLSAYSQPTDCFTLIPSSFANDETVHQTRRVRGTRQEPCLSLILRTSCLSLVSSQLIHQGS